jgi:hypothetical protein
MTTEEIGDKYAGDVFEVGAMVGVAIAFKSFSSVGRSAMAVRAKAGMVPWQKISGIVRDAARGKGNFGLGSGTVDEAMAAGKSWVGSGFKIASDGRTMISSDGLRQFRPPSFKPRLGKEQANFEWRNVNRGRWQGNGHLDIIKD